MQSHLSPSFFKHFRISLAVVCNQEVSGELHFCQLFVVADNLVSLSSELESHVSPGFLARSKHDIQDFIDLSIIQVARPLKFLEVLLDHNSFAVHVRVDRLQERALLVSPAVENHRSHDFFVEKV